MRVDLPDPGYTSSARARANFQLAVKTAVSFVLLLWLLHLLNWVFGLNLERFGILPRQWSGLTGIFFAPLLHGSFSHLISNSAPLIVLGVGMLYLYPNAAFQAITAVYVGTGLVVWFFARPALHIGASGLVYGLAMYIFVSGLIRWDVRAIAASMLVYFLYGTLAWGVLPVKTGMSWETHLAAAGIGLFLALHFRRLDVPPRKRYTWEDEDDNSDFR